MPIEIRELVIRAVVEPSPHERAGDGPAEDEGRTRLVQKCVDEVLKALRRERER
jgi:hypothetical protein